MKLPVYLYGHPVLRAVSEPVAKDAEGIKELVALMFDAMYESEGVGLAAPQIGKNIRLVVIDADPVSDSFPDCAGRKFALINPVVEVLDGDTVSRSGGLPQPSRHQRECAACRAYPPLVARRGLQRAQRGNQRLPCPHRAA